ncbi:glucose-6-phosphate isomerase [Wenzhouxiangella limi]|uniref:Glucose-6-phosphate isomerase n=1 Tax=Wenzhouxiangella limi TaxID=2707351 RepID=A0A845VGY9_9GAMM|nr:glucose-6-phosphate isomerase [Wenzhouxiangella limi]NDY96469.1 glucose-6-phosphate isomerase [Wenzhouxiangella limi]
MALLSAARDDYKEVCRVLRENNSPPEVADLFRRDPDRGAAFSVLQQGWMLDYSRIPLDRPQRDLLLDLPRRVQLRPAVDRLFDGAIVNPSEAQPALHMQLRGQDASPERLAERRQMLALADRLHSGRAGLTDLVHIGIGGSDLGPRLVADALDEDDSAVRVHWLSTLDGRRFERLLRQLDPARTGVVIASKSFSTEETMTQAEAMRVWMGKDFEAGSWASTANVDRAVAFGIRPEHVLPFPVWTGGRYSLWSSVGVSAGAQIGSSRFEELLAGAAVADQAMQRAPDASSLAVMLGLMIHYFRRELALPTLGVVAYEPRLALLGDYLQQLVMESLGKGVDLTDQPLAQPSVPLVYGGRGTDLQHSIFQALHQGTDTHPLLLVGSLADSHGHVEWQQAQLAHLLAQAAAFARGRHDGAPHRRLPGNRPVGVLLAERLTPEALGFLLASFEHAVYVLSVLWQINAYDQWGVEEGKRLAAGIRQRLANDALSLEKLAGFF